jgi:hypothetical protein
MRSFAEWLLAMGVLSGVVWVGTPLVQRLAPLGSSSVVSVQSALPDFPGHVPERAQSVPMLMLEDGAVVRLGMAEAEIRGAVLARWVDGPAISEEGVLDNRSVVPFKAGNTRFWVVLDRTEMGQDRRVTGIYVG